MNDSMKRNRLKFSLLQIRKTEVTKFGAASMPVARVELFRAIRIETELRDEMLRA